jgi:hypothetical protein
MGKKPHISNPIHFETTHPQTQMIEGTLSMAQDIKDKKIDTIQHNKAKQAMDLINKTLDATGGWLNEHRDDPSMNYVSDVGAQLFLDKIGPETELGQWLNKDKKAGSEYRLLMNEIFNIDVPELLPENFFDKVRRTLTREVKGAPEELGQVSQEFKRKNEDLRNSGKSTQSVDTASTASESDVSSETPSPKSSKK